MASSVLELLHHKEREDGDTNDKEKTKDDNNTGWEHCQWIVDIRVSWKKGKEEEEGGGTVQTVQSNSERKNIKCKEV